MKSVTMAVLRAHSVPAAKSLIWYTRNADTVEFRYADHVHLRITLAYPHFLSLVEMEPLRETGAFFRAILEHSTPDNALIIAPDHYVSSPRCAKVFYLGKSNGVINLKVTR